MRGIRERLAAMQPTEHRPTAETRATVAIESLLPGRVLSTAFGDLFVAERADLDHPVPMPRRCPPAACALYWPHVEPEPIEPEHVLFLDTETTGLASGTGTRAFIVGIAFWDQGQFRLQQFFLRSPADERGLLDTLVPLLERFKALVTFNGRTFDWPLLETRFILHGYRPAPPSLHFDLLHPARRVWKHRLSNCSLSNLEGSLFGGARQGDVPGFLIPRIYFDYLRDGDARRLRPVFAHNRDDVLTLVRLYDLLLRAHEEPAVSLPHPLDRLSLGLLYLSRGAAATAVPLLAQLLEDAHLPDAARDSAEMALCDWLKRQGRWSEMVALLERMSSRAARQRHVQLFAFEELAKHYEHVARDYAAALLTVERALRLLELRGQRAGQEQLLRRRSRLRRRLGDAAP